MKIRRASILLPCQHLESFPTHLDSQEAAELLAAWTTLWHPALIHATGRLPAWHPADDPPDPSELEHELVIVPSVSRRRLAGDWFDRVRATAPANPPPFEAFASREATIAAALQAASIAPCSIDPGLVGDFLALGFAHLQVELLTRAMRYSTVLDSEQFTNAVVAAARAAVDGEGTVAQEELGRAFDLLADARNHVYAVDFYVVEVTLLAPTTLGESLRAKLADGLPCSLLATGELIEQLADEHPTTLAELRRAVAAGTACIVSGPFHNHATGCDSPESLLASLQNTQQSIGRHLGTECQIFGQYHSAFSPLMPEVLAGMGYRGALHAAFDGGRLPRAEQCKTRWGNSDGAWLEALSATPLDLARSETWLKFAEHVGDSIAHDHVATVLLAGWPGQSCDSYQDVQRAARFNSVLGKLVTLEDYFRITRETDDWLSFAPREYPSQAIREGTRNPISTRINTYRSEVQLLHQQLAAGLKSIAETAVGQAANAEQVSGIVLNPWNFSCTQILGVDPMQPADSSEDAVAQALFLPDVPGCGFAEQPTAGDHRVFLADGNMLRNELLELTVSPATGGIQALRTHRDRSTRLSQRLVFHRHRAGRDSPTLDSQMIADHVEISRNDGVLGEITSRGRLLDAAGQLLSHFTQAVRLVRGLPTAIVNVQLEPTQPLEGDLWNNYFASRLAWIDEAVSFRRGLQWQARDTGSERIESPEFVEISNGAGNIVCFGLGLPCHRRASPTWLDTLMCVAGEDRRNFQFALGLDCTYPFQQALSLPAAGSPQLASLPRKFVQPRGWFLHVGAKNLLITHLEMLAGERNGFCCRILETEGRSVQSTLSAFRPIRVARITDFRAATSEVLSVVEGQVRFDIGAHRWLQIEAEW